MAVAGLRGTGDWGTDERPKNFREMILWRDPNGQAPLTALMSKMRTESTNDPQFYWWEEELNPVRIQVNGAITTSTYTTITVDGGDGEDLVPGDLLMIEATPTDGTAYTFEILRVDSVTSATQIVVSRGAAGTTASTTITDDAYLLRIGSAFEEGGTSPDSSTRNPTKYTNYTEIFKTTYEITNTAKVTRTRTGDPIKNDKKRKMFDHSVGLEHACLFGVPYEDTTTASNGKPLRYTGGLFYFLNQAVAAGDTHCIRVHTTSTSVTEDDFLDDTYKLFDYNAEGAGNERIVLAGNIWLNRLNKFIKNSSSARLNYDGVVDVFGMKLTRITIPQGTWYVRSHPLMNTNSLFSKGAFFINPAGIRWRPMSGRDTGFKDNIQANDADSTKGQWLTEGGCEYHHLKTMMYHGLHY